jgi:hypothetical protein
MDADGTYPSRLIPGLLARRDANEMVVGARNGALRAIPWIRRPAKWLLTQWASLLSGRRIPDLNSGLRVMRRDLVLRYMHLLPDGFSFTSTITLAMLANRHRVEYVTIDYLKREGKSKIRPIADTLNFARLILRTVMFFHPRRTLAPLVLLASACVGCAWLLARLV